ncbi:MAG: phenylacetate--CoA ligase family protein [Pseudodesulfovibrio sp.]|jgi:phenylacetate-CoA ligase|uniref:Phenylacetate--CoA ligase n=1 Tax=Pseudodesulfovibrio indicus TaxID=1716143 RepID=A0A126QLD3_9BACT|nr:AMP-binding protein [Pseudodesulfovibrio indicus]AMK10609.1 phenylacetate--CoA ligase [Pseudodesulfovibrio indicus]TDT82717.1 phenylacetate-CoA ligase [Pseudodesulfovibrio indicus]
MYYTEYETEPREKRMKRKWKGVKDVLLAAERASGEFRARLDGMGACAKDFKDWDDYGKIPPLRKRDIIEWQREHGIGWFLDCKPGELKRIYQSPGPIFDPEGREPDYWAWSEGFFAAGFRPGDLAQMTFSYHMTPAGLMLEEPLRNIGCAVIPAGPGNTEKQIEFLTGLPVTAFVGMTSYLKVIGEKAIALGLDPRADFHLEKAYVAAEPLPESLRAEVEELFGITVRQGYGTADVGCIAYECRELGGMHLSNYRHVEICDPATGLPLPDGEVGEVVVTPFFTDYPLVRLATGDLSSIDISVCGCGRTARKLTGWKGRADDTAKVKGQFIYPGQAGAVFAKYGCISGWQILVKHVKGRDVLVVLAETAEPFDTETFIADFQAVMKLKPVVETCAPGTLPCDAPRLVDSRTFD